jgi:hypothetical protein
VGRGHHGCCCDRERGPDRRRVASALEPVTAVALAIATTLFVASLSEALSLVGTIMRHALYRSELSRCDFVSSSPATRPLNQEDPPGFGHRRASHEIPGTTLRNVPSRLLAVKSGGCTGIVVGPGRHGGRVPSRRLDPHSYSSTSSGGKSRPCHQPYHGHFQQLARGPVFRSRIERAGCRRRDSNPRHADYDSREVSSDAVSPLLPVLPDALRSAGTPSFGPLPGPPLLPHGMRKARRD